MVPGWRQVRSQMPATATAQDTSIHRSFRHTDANAVPQGVPKIVGGSSVVDSWVLTWQGICSIWVHQPVSLVSACHFFAAGIQAVAVFWNQTLSGQHPDQRQSAQRKAWGLRSLGCLALISLILWPPWAKSARSRMAFFWLLENSQVWLRLGQKYHLANMNDLSLRLIHPNTS